MKPGVKGTYLEKVHSACEEVNDFLAGRITISIAAGWESVDARPVLVPLVLPEVLARSRVWQPDLIHVGKQRILACCFEDWGYVVVLGCCGAELVIGAIAEIWPATEIKELLVNCYFVGRFNEASWPRRRSLPESMQSPAISRSYSWVGIPELSLKELTARIDEAAAVTIHGTGIMTAQRAIRRTTWSIWKRGSSDRFLGTEGNLIAIIEHWQKTWGKAHEILDWEVGGHSESWYSKIVVLVTSIEMKNGRECYAVSSFKSGRENGDLWSSISRKFNMLGMESGNRWRWRWSSLAVEHAGEGEMLIRCD